jgi:hypothetical protein
MAHFDLLTDAEFGKRIPQHSWQIKGHHLKREALHIDDMDGFIKRYGEPNDAKKRSKLEQDIRKNPLAHLRTVFLREEFMADVDGMGRGIHNPRAAGSGWKALKETGAFDTMPLSALPRYSAAWSLSFELLTPLLTADDDPFYLFDNPLRKDHTFGLPYLSAAALKGLSADAYQRSFPGAVAWNERGKDDPERTRHFRGEDGYAARLFGIATDDDQADSLRGRLHFSPLWLEWVQYLVMNPMNQDKGIGTQPIHFEAASPRDDKGKAVQATVRGFYFNPLGAPGSDEAAVRADMARFIAALAVWWPALGLGAKRLAGYGAIKPVSIRVEAVEWTKWPAPGVELKGEQSWQQMAQKIAEEVK